MNRELLKQVLEARETLEAWESQLARIDDGEEDFGIMTTIRFEQRDKLNKAIQAIDSFQAELTKDDPEFDGTDFAHPAWWRGSDHTIWVFVERVNKILSGEDTGDGVSREPWESLRRRLIKLAKPESTGNDSLSAEPVAWMYEAATYYPYFQGRDSFTDFKKCLEFDKPRVPEGSIRYLTPLYTSPQFLTEPVPLKRIPLTYKEIANYIDDLSVGSIDTYEFARAIEAKVYEKLGIV